MEIESGGHSDIGNPAGPIALRGGADYGMEARAPARSNREMRDEAG